MTIREIIIDEIEKALERGVKFPREFEIRIPSDAMDLYRKETGNYVRYRTDEIVVTFREDPAE